MFRAVNLTSPEGDYRSRVPRVTLDVTGATEAVRGVCDAVRDWGTKAPVEHSQRFDDMVPGTFRTSKRVLAGAAGQLDPELREASEESIRRRRLVAETLERDSGPAPTILIEGARIGLRNIPVEQVGLCVPGGLVPLASSVVMNAVPAQVVGIREITVASSPQAGFGGQSHPNILALRHMLGIEEVYAVGGAQVVTVFAHGVTGLYVPVATVIGLGNIYVVTAKRLLRGIVGIDSEAGSTEIAIIADSSANPAYIAADLISQAEHDPMVASALITGSSELAGLVAVGLESWVTVTKHREWARAVLMDQQSAVLLVRDLDRAMEVADTYAAEYLRIQIHNAGKVASRIRNADTIFIGDRLPVSLGDYSADSAHVLSTAGCTCHGSDLDVHSLTRTVHVTDCSTQALSEIADGIEQLALTKDLPGHAVAITARTRR